MIRPNSILFFLIPGILVFLLAIAVLWLFRDPRTPVIDQTLFGPIQIISEENDGPKRVFASDVDGDNDIDVLSISIFDDKLAWYENLDGEGTFGPQQLISTEFVGGDGVSAGDLDGDGDVDVLSASSGDGKIAWYENLDGNGTFGPQKIISSMAPMAYFVVAVDFDQDQDLDVYYDIWDADSIAWQENLDGKGTFGEVIIISEYAYGASSVFPADLDGDGDQDALFSAAVGNQIAWHENLDGQGTFSTMHPITIKVDFPYSVFAADLDRDGDQDVLSGSSQDNTIAWYENMDGQGTFGFQNVIDDEAILAAAVYTADLDRDGDQDVLAASSGNNTISWYENDGTGNFSNPNIISDQLVGTFSVIVADLDRDGDQDVIGAALDGDQIFWFENLTPHMMYFPILSKSETD